MNEIADQGVIQPLNQAFSATFFCSSFYASHGIPIAAWSDGKRLTSAGLPWGAQPDVRALPLLLAIASNLSVVELNDGGYYGLIIREESGHAFVIGPVYEKAPRDDQVTRFMRDCEVSVHRLEEIAANLRSIPESSKGHFTALLSFLNFALNGAETAEREEYNQSVYESASDVHSQHVLVAEDESLNRVFFTAKQIAHDVSRGDIDEIWAHLEDRYQLTSTMPRLTNLLAYNTMRALKDEFIVYASETFLHGVILGGLDQSTAVRTMAGYIERCESARTEREVDWLFQAMLADAVSMVNESDTVPGLTREVKECMWRISSDLTKWLSIDELAEGIGCSRSHLTSLFRAETGMSINQYSRILRVERAKRLLRYSDYSLGTISMSLGFSSQPYFTNTFRKETGATPSQYRASSNIWAEEDEI